MRRMDRKQKGTEAQGGHDTCKPHSSKGNNAKPKHQHLTTLLLHLCPRPLRVEDLLPASPRSFISIPNFLSPKECRSIVSLGAPRCHALRPRLLRHRRLTGGRPAGEELPWERVAHAASKLYASRDNDRIHWVDAGLARRVWECTGLASMMAEVSAPFTGSTHTLRAVGLNTGWRLYRYKQGQHFGAHYDDSVECPDFPGAVSLYTMLVYLNDDFQGGETTFYKNKRQQMLSVSPAIGMALLHTQGPLCSLHEGAAVSSGCKWLLRTDVMYA